MAVQFAWMSEPAGKDFKNPSSARAFFAAFPRIVIIEIDVDGFGLRGEIGNHGHPNP